MSEILTIKPSEAQPGDALLGPVWEIPGLIPAFDERGDVIYDTEDVIDRITRVETLPDGRIVWHYAGLHNPEIESSEPMRDEEGPVEGILRG